MDVSRLLFHPTFIPFSLEIKKQKPSGHKCASVTTITTTGTNGSHVTLQVLYFLWACAYRTSSIQQFPWVPNGDIKCFVILICLYSEHYKCEIICDTFSAQYPPRQGVVSCFIRLCLQQFCTTRVSFFAFDSWLTPWHYRSLNRHLSDQAT